MAGFNLKQIEEKPNTIWVKNVNFCQPVGMGNIQHIASFEFEECDLNELDSLGENDDDDRDLLMRKIRDWKGFTDEDEDGKKAQVEFDKDTFETLLSKLWFLPPLRDSYLQRCSGKSKGRKGKN